MTQSSSSDQEPDTTKPPANRVADLLAAVLERSHPGMAAVSEQVKRTATTAFLEHMETHNAGLINPLLASVSDTSDIPPELASLLADVGMPTQQVSAFVSQFFVFGLMFTLGQALLAPFVQKVQDDVWAAHPDRPLGAPDIATAVARGMTLGDPPTTTVPRWAYEEAAKNGMDKPELDLLASIVGMPPALQELFTMRRRGYITTDQLKQGLREGDFRDDWIDSVSQLVYSQPSPIDFVAAAVQAQLPYDTAAAWATKTGLEPPGFHDNNPDWFKLLYDVHGRPPGPQEVSRMALRGIVPWQGLGPESTTFQQAIAESDVKTKWTDALQALSRWVPPAGTVHTLLVHGGITAATAESLWQEDGITPEIAKALAYTAQHEQITTDKALAKGDILTMIQEGIFDVADGIAALEVVGYSGAVADGLVKMSQFRFGLQTLRSAVRKLSQAYVQRKLTTVEAKDGLLGLGLSDEATTKLLALLSEERSQIVVIPTSGEVMSAYHYGVVDQSTAMEMLESLGYEPWSAWFVLSARQHAALPNEPPRGTILAKG